MLNEKVATKTNEVAELDLVFINDKSVMTDSLLVAKAFKKSHKNVLADIREIITHLEEFGGRLKFQPSEYISKQGKKFPKFIMDKDAFLMLVMGYRGAKAVEVRYRYIQEFNAMRELIHEISKSRQDILFKALREDDISKIEASFASKILNKRKRNIPRLLKAIEDARRDMQESIDFAFTDNNKIEH